MAVSTDVPSASGLGYAAGARPSRGVPPDVSVVIATCNRPHTLLHAVRSALDQADTAVEVIVVDDSPAHSAAGVIAGMDEPRVRYVAHGQPSKGRPAIARNAGVRLAKAPLVHFLDDDDTVSPGHYAAARRAFARHPGLGVVFGRIEPFGEDAAEVERQSHYFGRAEQRARRCAWLGHRWAFTAAMVFGPTLLVCGAGMVRRAQVDAIGGFDTVMPLMEDVDFYTRAIRCGGAMFLDRPALRYRIGPSLMRQPNRDALIAESYRLSQARYRARHGMLEFMTLRALAEGFRLT